ncbi:neurogenic locus protein delta [Oratosquilla oratoria]|uniref:neurogenic locus protein delta n=1 Tax=Oratosquilla oratoria TaxID=337810 RepID=UPI003F768843
MRWLKQNVAIVAATVVLLLCISETTANARFELRLKQFVNTYGKDSQGHCCSGYKNKNGKCSGNCATKFRVCLNVYQAEIDLSSPCAFGEATTPVLGHNRVDFETVEGFTNPIMFDMPSWQGTFSLIIEAWHEENNGTESYAGPVLITRLMTQRWLDLDEAWTSDDHHTNHSFLSYSFRVVCKENYYGEGCRKWCRPRDDNFGHYVCNATGYVVCLPGWQGPDNYCVTAVCATGCHPENGHCEKPYECKCKRGWQGARCDECKVYPGCFHGTCDKPFKCNCDEGWGGLFCNQDLNYCTNHRPCMNGATCFNTEPGSYSCQCPAGFSGTNCEIVNDNCANEPCKNGGTCLESGNSTFVCQCPMGYRGQYCEITGKTCSDRPCLNGATCLDLSDGYECRCPSGFEGPNCERAKNECASSPCLNGASCVDQHDGFKCVCPVGFMGHRCETKVDHCAHQPCFNGGTCIDGTNSFTCQCRAGFVGELCQDNVDDCATRPCANGGRCIDLVNSFKCECTSGFEGEYCNRKVDLNPCASNPCHNGGTCTITDRRFAGYQCTCPPGIMGLRCDVNPQLVSGGHTESAGPMSAAQVVLIVTFSVAVPLLAVISAIVIVCMKRRRRQDRAREDEEARRQNEQNMVHNAVNSVNNCKTIEGNMIFNSLDYPCKPLNTKSGQQLHQQQQHHQHLHTAYHPEPDYKSCEKTYSIVATRSTKTLNTDVSRLSLAEKLEKDLESLCGATTPHPRGPSPHDFVSVNSGMTAVCKPVDHHNMPRSQSNSEVYSKRPGSVGLGGGVVSSSSSSTSSSNNNNDVHNSTHTLSSTCSPSTCTTPSSVYVIEEHYDDDSYIATEV